MRRAKETDCKTDVGEKFNEGYCFLNAADVKKPGL